MYIRKGPDGIVDTSLNPVKLSCHSLLDLFVVGASCAAVDNTMGLQLV